MTKLQLYKFVVENNLEYKYFDKREIYLFIPYSLIEDFSKLLTPGIFEGGVGSVMKDGYFSFDIFDICDYYGIDADSIFSKN